MTLYSFHITIQIGPPTFQKPSLTFINNKLYMYGGRSSMINQNIYELNLEKWFWTKIPNAILKGRFGHQAECWQGKFI